MQLFCLGKGRQRLKKFSGFVKTPLMQQEPGIHRIQTVAVVDTVIRTGTQQGIHLREVQPQGKSNVENIFPAGGLILIIEPVLDFFADRSGIGFRVVVLELLNQTQQQIIIVIHFQQNAAEGTDLKPFFLQILRCHFGRHLAGGNQLVFFIRHLCQNNTHPAHSSHFLKYLILFYPVI